MRMEMGITTEQSTCCGDEDDIGYERVGPIIRKKQSMDVVAEAFGTEGAVFTLIQAEAMVAVKETLL